MLPTAEARDLFVRRTEELLDLPLVREGGLRTGFHLSAGEDKPTVLATARPAEDPFRSFLVTFRQFVMAGEPIEMNRTANGLWRELEGERVRDLLVDRRQRWRMDCKKGHLQLIVDGTTVEPEDLLDLWLNGRYFHADTRKEARLLALERAGVPFTEQVMVDHVIAGTNYIRFLASLIVSARQDGLIT